MSMGGVEAWLHAAAISGATFVSEDATCIATGLLIRARQIGGAVGVAACTLGIFLGDLGLWLLGRLFGRRVLAWRWVSARLPTQRVDQLGQWFERHGWKAIVAARFLPGTRFPVYVTAGVVGRRASTFVLWALVAALLWTPALVLLVAALGEVIVTPLQRLFGAGWLAFAVALVALWVALRVVPRLITPTGRAQLTARIARLWRWEFWPAWVFYIPLVPWIGYLALRHRGFMTITAANPGIVPHGGIVGESKFAILSRLPAEWIVPSALIESGTPAERVALLEALRIQRGWPFPLILKPDVGQRGVGLRLIRDLNAAQRYFEVHPEAVLAQTYHPGPLEAGIFYCRLPGAARGALFSITDKQFPVLEGDGVTAVEALIWRHPRYRMQARTFLARLNGQADVVLPAGERLPLAVAGNHCQGTLFRDGSHLHTPALEAAIDAIAAACDGFHFGRFDVRYADVEALRAGRGFAIVELNGITSESTNLYDPAWPLWRAYRVLFQQWALLYRIGAENRRRGHAASALRDVVADARRYYATRGTQLASD